MTIQDILIKFQEYQLEFNVLNANCAHNAAAIMFMERYGVKNCSIYDVSQKRELLLGFLETEEARLINKGEIELHEGIESYVAQL